MRKTLVFAFAFFFASTSAFAAADSDAKKQEMMKKWMEFSTPAEGHKIFKELVGNWKYTSKYWETKDGKPQESKGTSKIKLILGGRFLQHETKGKAMGMPFEGIGITGFNNMKKKYETIWLDNMSTGMMTGKGEYDVATKTLKDKGEYTCPMSGDDDKEYRSEWKVVDKKHMVYTMYGPAMDSNDEIKQMELSFTRM